MKRRVLPVAVIAVLLASPGCAMAQDYAVGSLTMTDLWTPATPDTAKDAPGYLTIINRGSTADRLIGGSFANARHVEIHAATAGGKAMERSAGVAINPGETVTLRPGGDHVMFVGLRSGLTPGDTEQAVLTFERAGAKTVEFQVRAVRPAGKRPQAKVN